MISRMGTGKSLNFFLQCTELDHQSLTGLHALNCTQPIIARTPRIQLFFRSHTVRGRYWSAQIDGPLGGRKPLPHNSTLDQFSANYLQDVCNLAQFYQVETTFKSIYNTGMTKCKVRRKSKGKLDNSFKSMEHQTIIMML